MLPDEKNRLAEFFSDARRWCQGAEARDAKGQAVHYDDPSAVAWDITGGVCALFGWPRARELFLQLDRHVHRIRRHPRWLTSAEIASMIALQNTNDENDTTFEMITRWLETMPAWNGHRRKQG